MTQGQIKTQSIRKPFLCTFKVLIVFECLRHGEKFFLKNKLVLKKSMLESYFAKCPKEKSI
jgi:hypothetical protein